MVRLPGRVAGTNVIVLGTLTAFHRGPKVHPDLLEGCSSTGPSAATGPPALHRWRRPKPRLAVPASAAAVRRVVPLGGPPGPIAGSVDGRPGFGSEAAAPRRPNSQECVWPPRGTSPPDDWSSSRPPCGRRLWRAARRPDAAEGPSFCRRRSQGDVNGARSVQSTSSSRSSWTVPVSTSPSGRAGDRWSKTIIGQSIACSTENSLKDATSTDSSR